MIHVRISSEQGSEFGIDDPRNLRMRMCFANQCDCGQRVNDVTELTWLDDQDGFGIQVASFAVPFVALRRDERLRQQGSVNPF